LVVKKTKKSSLESVEEGKIKTCPKKAGAQASVGVTIQRRGEKGGEEPALKKRE